MIKKIIGLLLAIFVFTKFYGQSDTTVDVLVYVENLPVFPGGTERMFEIIKKNIVYPENAFKEARLEMF